MTDNLIGEFVCALILFLFGTYFVISGILTIIVSLVLGINIVQPFAIGCVETFSGAIFVLLVYRSDRKSNRRVSTPEERSFKTGELKEELN